MAFQSSGDTVVLLGSSALRGEPSSLAGSEYLEVVHDLVVGQPALDIDLEIALQSVCRHLVSEGIARSAHDCSDGGLAVALAESCIAGNMGLMATAEISGRWNAALFGETQSRIVISLSSSDMGKLTTICSEEGVPFLKLGVTEGDSLIIGSMLDVAVTDLRASWQGGIPQALDQH